MKRRCMETKHDIKKLCEQRKADKGHSQMFTQARTVETMPQNPTFTQPAVVAVPMQQAATTVLHASNYNTHDYAYPSSGNCIWTAKNFVPCVHP